MEIRSGRAHALGNQEAGSCFGAEIKDAEHNREAVVAQVLAAAAGLTGTLIAVFHLQGTDVDRRSQGEVPFALLQKWDSTCPGVAYHLR